MRVAIIGAGIVGSAVAHALLDEGHAVTLIDRLARDARPSNGNAGWIAHTDILPLASSKAWRNMPRWLADPLGPLAIRPAYLPTLAPWLWRFVRASAPRRVEAGITAIRAINARALPAWEKRLASLGLDEHLHRRGRLSVWRDAVAFRAERPILERQRRLGIEAEELDAAGVARLEPALTGVAGGVLFPAVCHVSDPGVLAAELMQLATARGATHVAADARQIIPGTEGVVVQAGEASVAADRVVIATGAWSRPLAAQLGLRVPLDTERGYNATYAPGTFGLNRPVMFEGDGFAASPLATGDRVGGAVEFAGLDAPPDHRRTDAMIAKLRRYLPHLEADAPARKWMGFRPSIPDSLPAIGPVPRAPRVVLAFGHGHHGLTQAAVTAEMVAAIIAGRDAGFDLAPYAPARFA